MFTFVNLWNLSEKTLFDNIELPIGIYTATLPDGELKELTITPDKETLVNTILDEVAEYQPYTIDVDVMKMKINNFFKKNKEGFSRLIALNLVTYSPIENTDRYESSIDTYKRDTTIKDTGVNSEDTTDVSKGSINNGGSTTDENTISAYDSNTYQPNNKQSHTDNTSQLTANSNTSNVTGSNVNTHIDDIDDVNKHNLRTHGNIGVTTNQQMMTQEVDFWNTFNFYDIVANKFLFEMCLTCESYN